MVLRPTTLWGGAFVAYASASLLWSLDSSTLAGAMLASLVCCYLIGRFVSDLKKVWFTYCLFLIANLALIPLTLSDLDFSWGLFGNPNHLGCALALGLAGAVAYRLWLFVPFLAGGVLYTNSRTALMGLATIGLVSLWNWSRVVALSAVLLAGVTALSVSSGRDNSLLARIGIWNDTIDNALVLGSGFGSFGSAYSKFVSHKSPTEHMTGVQAAHAYNDFLELTFELGIGACLLWITFLHSLESPAPDRLILFAYFAMALTFFPLWVPLVGQLVAMSVGQMARQTRGVRYEISSRHSALS